MIPKEIKAKSLELAALYTSLAAGKQLQFHCGETFPIWVDCKPMDTPRLSSDLRCYRIKPERRRVWVRVEEGYVKVCTYDQALAECWRGDGHRVIETVEVLP